MLPCNWVPNGACKLLRSDITQQCLSVVIKSLYGTRCIQVLHRFPVLSFIKTVAIAMLAVIFTGCVLSAHSEPWNIHTSKRLDEMSLKVSSLGRATRVHGLDVVKSYIFTETHQSDHEYEPSHMQSGRTFAHHASESVAQDKQMIQGAVKLYMKGIVNMFWCRGFLCRRCSAHVFSLGSPVWNVSYADW
jgi:hypothetical protein